MCNGSGSNFGGGSSYDNSFGGSMGSGGFQPNYGSQNYGGGYGGYQGYQPRPMYQPNYMNYGGYGQQQAQFDPMAMFMAQRQYQMPGGMFGQRPTQQSSQPPDASGIVPPRAMDGNPLFGSQLTGGVQAPQTPGVGWRPMFSRMG